VVVVRDRAQALTIIADHPCSLARLVCSQFWLGPEFDAPLFGNSSATIRTGQDAGPLILGQGRQKGEGASAERRSQI
jgi:hypothetical protein